MSKIILEKETGVVTTPVANTIAVYVNGDGNLARKDETGTVVVFENAATAVSIHEGESDPHPQYLTPLAGAGLFEPINAITNHEGLSDPHPQYLTVAEGNAAFDALGAVTTHEGLSDPHPQYLTQTEADAVYSALAHVHATGNLITVSKTPAANEFSTLSAALAAIGTGGYAAASTTNRYVIKVGPGEYSEAPFTVPAYVYVSGNDPWNSAVLKTTDLTNDFITVAPNGGLFNIAVSGPTTAGKSTVKQVASGTTKLYWVNIKEGSYGVTLAPTSGTARCHCIGVVTDGPTVMNRMFNCDNPAGVGVFILMQSGPMSTTWTGTQPSAVYLNGNGSTAPYKANATLDLCQFRGSNYDSVYADNAGLVRGICCSFAGGTNAIHVGPNGTSKVDMHGSQIKPGSYTNKDIWCESTTGLVSFSGVATESKLLIASGATFVGTFADTDAAIGGQVIFGELWIGNTTVKTPLASYIQADKNTGLVSGGGLSRGAGARQVDVAAGVAFIDTASGLKKVSWNATTITISANADEARIFVDSTGVVQYQLTSLNKELNCLLGEAGTNATSITYLFDNNITLPQFRPKLYSWMEHVIGPINSSGGLITASGLGFDVTASTYYLTEAENSTADVTGASFNYWYRDGAGGWTVTPGTTSINDTQYDDGTGTLATMTAGYWRRDTVYVSKLSTGATEFNVFMGQEQFATEVEADVNPLAADPISEHACRLAALVIQKSAASFTVVDQRPKLGQMSASSSGVTNHNDLAGRDSSTAHTQYQLNSEKGNPNGYAELDGAGTIPQAQIPTIAHGNQAGGSLHSAVTTSVDGFMTATDKTKLNNIASGATANATDAQLRDRTTHTGEQATSTITGLDTALSGKVPSSHVGSGGAEHADVVAAGASGFMTGTDKTKLDSVTIANLPTANEKAGLAGTSGTAVDAANKLVDSADSRMSNARVAVPQGATTQVQFNNAGTSDGATNVTIDLTDERLVLPAAAGSAVVAAPAAGLKVFSRRKGGRNLLVQVGSAGVETALQAALFSNKVGLWIPQGNATTVQTLGMPAGTATGTATTRNVATTNLLTSMRRIGYVSANTAGSLSGLREAIAQHFCSNVANLGGFFVVMRFGIAAVTADSRWFVGLDNGTAAPTNTEPSTINNTVGFGCRAADTNVQAWSRATANITPQDTAIAGKTANAVYEVRMFCKPNSQVIGMSLERIDVAGYWEIEDIGAVTANQTVNTLLGLKLWITNNGTNSAVAIDICSLYKETDN